MVVPHLLTLADLSGPQIKGLIKHAYYLKQQCAPWLKPLNLGKGYYPRGKELRMPPQSLFLKTVALMFSKRSTRTRVAAETSTVLLGGKALFLGKEDIQLGVNESLRDTTRIVGGMCEGIFARVGEHKEIEELAKYSPVPVINALSSLWHPTQVLADLMTLHEHANLFKNEPAVVQTSSENTSDNKKKTLLRSLPELQPLTIAYVGDSANVLHDMLVAFPRLGHKMRIATPEDPKYRAPKEVWDTVTRLGCDKNIWWGTDPKEAVKDADVVCTDTWISMGQEAEYDDRVKAFQGYQVTEEMCRGAKEHWKFMHCLPRKQHEVNDEVFYGPRSLVFPEADNRKWTTMAVFDLVFGKWSLDAPSSYKG